MLTAAVLGQTKYPNHKIADRMEQMMKQLPVIILGAGGVGQALLQQIVAGRQVVADRNGMRFNVVAVADSQRWLWNKDGLSDETILQLVERKRGREPMGEPRPTLPELLQYSADQGLENVTFVDVTATDGMEPILAQALSLGYGVVLANKKPLAGPYETAKQFFNNPFVRHESTVGGGQPVIATLRYLLDTNDPIYSIEGQLSGTLGYLCQRLDADVSYSTAIAEAKARGYTEPDPRDDLGGQDVMRKILILARMAGWPLEASEIEVEALYHSSLAHLSVPEFMAATVAMDPMMRDRVLQARAEGMVLRYLAQLSEGKGRVGLTSVPQGSGLANLKYIKFDTSHYHDEPLMVCGKGAGVGMTAAGVHGDLIGLGREVF